MFTYINFISATTLDIKGQPFDLILNRLLDTPVIDHSETLKIGLRAELKSTSRWETGSPDQFHQKVIPPAFPV